MFTVLFATPVCFVFFFKVSGSHPWLAPRGIRFTLCVLPWTLGNHVAEIE